MVHTQYEAADHDNSNETKYWINEKKNLKIVDEIVRIIHLFLPASCIQYSLRSFYTSVQWPAN